MKQKIKSEDAFIWQQLIAIKKKGWREEVLNDFTKRWCHLDWLILGSSPA